MGEPEGEGEWFAHIFSRKAGTSTVPQGEVFQIQRKGLIVDRIVSAIDKLFLHCIGIALAAVVSICLLQVIARYVFSASFCWAEEISVTLVLWSVWIGASLAVKSNTHLRLTLLEKRLSPETRLILSMVLKSLIILFVVSIYYASRTVLQANENITLMSLPITVNVMYWSVPFGSLLMTFYCLRSIWDDCKELRSLGPKR